MELNTRSSKQADIGLILEGTYPYVRGGVSSWVHQIISGLPEFTFALMFIGDKPESYEKMQYELPDNVVDLRCIYIIKSADYDNPKSCPGNQEVFEQIDKMQGCFAHREQMHLAPKILKKILSHTQTSKTLTVNDFLYSEASWQCISKRYMINASESSFLDYFWTIRAMHGPVFQLIEQLENAVDAKVYHTISTGYAGLFSVMLNLLHERPLILTEHGIYTKERKIDLSQVDWINDAEAVFGHAQGKEISYLRRLWIRFFESIGQLVYSTADPILSISEGNKRRQIFEGASGDKISVIPNAVNLDKFRAQRAKRPESPPLIIGFIGRVVPIKDVKTFIRAMSSVCSNIPEAEAWIIGGEEEDPEYAEECRDMIESLQLTKNIIYKGFCNVAEVLPELGCVVLSSISEGVPLVIMEAFACGIPVVSTDVGACRELIEGGGEEDQALGVAGGVVSIADSEGLADEISRILSHEAYWRRCCTTAEMRADKYFDEQGLFNAYRAIYKQALER